MWGQRIVHKIMDCVFCKIIAGEIPSTRVYEDAHAVAFLDIKPITTGHLLIVPKKHSRDVIDADDATLAHLMSLAPRMGAAVMAALEADGFNMGVNTGSAAGQIVMHTHVHIIPRYIGDGLVHWGHQDVTREELERTAVKIRGAV